MYEYKLSTSLAIYVLETEVIGIMECSPPPNFVFYYFLKSETMWVVKDFWGEIWVAVLKILRTTAVCYSYCYMFMYIVTHSK